MAYFRTGKEVLYRDGDSATAIHIADAGDNEQAHFIVTALNQRIVNALNRRSSNFIRDALRTCSPNFYGEKVSRTNFVQAMNAAIDALNKLDKIKKSLFYGRDNNLDPTEGTMDVADLPERMQCSNTPEVAIDLIHGILGKATEAGELLEALRHCYNGNDLDFVNINEEIGDGFWYDAILLNRTGSTFEEVQERIIAKLRARFPDKYADASANERNLEAERAILEGEPVEAPQVFPVDHVGKPIMKPGELASGKEAVEKAAASAAKVFDDVKREPVDRSYEPPYDPELAKSPAERFTPLPDEGMAQQQKPKKK